MAYGALMHEARADFDMLLGALYLLIEGGGAWSVDASGFQELELDFVADNPGLTLFHCHQRLHMDFGFMALFS